MHAASSYIMMEEGEEVGASLVMAHQRHRVFDYMAESHGPLAVSAYVN